MEWIKLFLGIRREHQPWWRVMILVKKGSLSGKQPFPSHVVTVVSTQISFYGGQVLSWKNEQGEELLFLSSKATFKPPAAVRGGIPICFPQFGSRGLLEQHGFARNRMWVVDDEQAMMHSNEPNGHACQASINLLLKPSDEDLKIWPHRFEFRVRISLSDDGQLILMSRIRNSNGKPFSFSIAFRTYFSISDISEVRVEGLETLDFLDNICEREHVIAVFDHGKKRTFQIRKQGLPDVAVWNPWEKKAKALADLGDEEYKYMLCVDGATVEKPIMLKPGEEWSGRVELSVLSSC
ncbi:putative glucose-6-phosphate 1-epimerase [Drosera capensis]